MTAEDILNLVNPVGFLTTKTKPYIEKKTKNKHLYTGAKMMPKAITGQKNTNTYDYKNTKEGKG